MSDLKFHVHLQLASRVEHQFRCSPTIASLNEHIQSQLQYAVDSYRMYYVDDDHDKVLLENDCDVVEALKAGKGTAWSTEKPLRLLLYRPLEFPSLRSVQMQQEWRNIHPVDILMTLSALRLHPRKLMELGFTRPEAVVLSGPHRGRKAAPKDQGTAGRGVGDSFSNASEGHKEGRNAKGSGGGSITDGGSSQAAAPLSLPDTLRKGQIMSLASIVSHPTYPPGATVAAGASFEKQWRVFNATGVSWPVGTRLVPGPPVVLAKNFQPPPATPVAAAGAEKSVTVSLVLQAPAAAGRYTAWFRLEDSVTGKRFGHRLPVVVDVLDAGTRCWNASAAHPQGLQVSPFPCRESVDDFLDAAKRAGLLLPGDAVGKEAERGEGGRSGNEGRGGVKDDAGRQSTTGVQSIREIATDNDVADVMEQGGRILKALQEWQGVAQRVMEAAQGMRSTPPSKAMKMDGPG